MLKNIIVFPDGSEIASSTVGASNIRSCTITESVNSGTELTLGSVCSSMLEVRLQIVGNRSIEQGTEITLYKEDEQQNRTKMGVFILEKPTRPTMNTYKITAYDRIIFLDRDLSSWISSLNGWPYTIRDFAEMVCQQCGLELAEGWDDLPNGENAIQKFTSNVTGRQLIQWVGEANCRFFRVNADGKGEFSWYQNAEKDITPSGEIYILQGTLDYEDYEVTAIEKVLIQLTNEDDGVSYPNIQKEYNTYRISNNELLYNVDGSNLRLIAQNIYNILSSVRYTPCQVSIPANLDIHAGNIVNITDKSGRTIRAYVFTKKQSGQRDTLECTGSSKRDSPTVTNNETLKNLSGKLYTVEKNVDGLRSVVTGQSGELTQLLQKAGEVSVSVLTNEGTLSTVIDKNSWKAQFVDSAGEEKSGIHFDFQNGRFVFNGTGQFGGVKEGDTYIAVNGSELQLFDEIGTPMLRIGQYRQNKLLLFPYIKFFTRLTGDPNLDEAGMLLRTQTGLWIGNESIDLKSTTGPGVSDLGFCLTGNSAGIFISTAKDKVTIYNGTNGKDFYVGEAIAKFG